MPNVYVAKASGLTDDLQGIPLSGTAKDVVGADAAPDDMGLAIDQFVAKLPGGLPSGANVISKMPLTP